MHGSTLRVGLDGNLHHADGSPADEGGGATTMAEIDAASKSLLDDRYAAGLTINGRVAVEAVSGAVTDFDAISVKPHYRPHLAASGSKSRTDLQRFRAMGRRPDASFDLSNAGSVSHEDYQLAKRFDVGDKGYLTPLEHAAAQEALAGGLREKFTRMSTGSSRALTARTFQRADGTVECEGADTVEGDVGPREKYDATVRLPTAGIAPGLDLPPEVAAGTGKPTASRSADAHYLASSTATTLNVSLKGVDRTKPFVSTSIGAIPGVARAVVRLGTGNVLQITITERQPAWVWRTEAGLILLDDTGHRIAGLADRADRADLPLIAGEGADQAIPEAMALLQTASPFENRIRGLVRVGTRRWDLVLDRNQSILLPADNPVTALNGLIALNAAENILARDLTSVDLRNPQRPVLRLAPAALDALRAAHGIKIPTESKS